MKTILMSLMSIALMFGAGVQASVAQKASESTEKASPTRHAQGPSSNERDAALTMEGEIARVDTQKNLFWLKTADGSEMEFSYVKDTPIDGVGVATEGLRDVGPEKGMHVKVEYDNVSGANVVRRIEIQPAKG